MNTLLIQEGSPQTRFKLLVETFDLSLTDLAHATARHGSRRVSRSQAHRILHGQQPTATERQALAEALIALIKERTDSAYLFEPMMMEVSP